MALSGNRTDPRPARSRARLLEAATTLLRANTGRGTEAVHGAGFRGRAGVHELMVVSRALRRLIQTGSRAEALQETALREGMRTLRQDGIEKVWAGVTTTDEVRAISNS